MRSRLYFIEYAVNAVSSDSRRLLSVAKRDNALAISFESDGAMTMSGNSAIISLVSGSDVATIMERAAIAVARLSEELLYLKKAQ